MNSSTGKEKLQAEQEDLVTVVIPAFHARSYLPEALASVRAQSYSSWELVVVDDCSPEQVDDLVQAFAATVPGYQVRLIRHSENKRLGAARNTGILAANGEYVAFLDHDDVWRENHLRDAMVAMKSESADLVYCDLEVFHEKAGDILNWHPYPPDFWGPFPDNLYVQHSIAPSGVVMRKQTLKTLGLFDTNPSVHMCEDMDLWLRAAGTGCKFVHIPKPNLLYRFHSQSGSANKRSMSAAKAYVLLKNLKAIPQVPLSLRLNRTCTVCAEAARDCRADDPGRAAYFYLLSFRTDPKRLKHLCAYAYYSTINFCHKIRTIYARYR